MTKPYIGIAFDGFLNAAQTVELAAAAEQAGASGIWYTEHMGYRDGLTASAAMAVATKHAMVIPTAVSPYLWHPSPTAMAMATIAELAPRRTAIAISVGNIRNLQESGIEADRPLRVIREYIEDLRALWSGEPVHRDGQIYRLNGMRMAFSAQEPIPIYVASTGEKILQLAGETGDGVLLSGGLTPAHAKWSLDQIAIGAERKNRDLRDFRTAGLIYCAVSHDEAAAEWTMRKKLAFLFRSPPHRANIESSGFAIDQIAIIETVFKRNIDAAAELVPAEAVRAFAIVGSPKSCRDQLQRYIDIGLTEPVIEVSGTPEEQMLALELVREVAGS